MKSSMKKLAVFVMMAAIAMFIVVVTASAGDRDRDGHHKGIIGEYGFSTSNKCISTVESNWVSPPSSSSSPLGTVQNTSLVTNNDAHGHGVVTFKHDGTGTADAYGFQTPSSTSAWGAPYFHVTYSFTYTVTHDGKITIKADSGTYRQDVISLVTPDKPTNYYYTRDKFSLTGWVSADHKTITLASPAPEVARLTVTAPDNSQSFYMLICHYSQVWVRLDE